jgi:hypothetical protein
MFIDSGGSPIFGCWASADVTSASAPIAAAEARTWHRLSGVITSFLPFSLALLRGAPGLMQKFDISTLLQIGALLAEAKARNPYPTFGNGFRACRNAEPDRSKRA